MDELNDALTTPKNKFAQKAFSVTEVNTMIADVLSSSLPGYLHIEGEVSNLSVAASGHRYFSLKDSGSTISCALFKGSVARIDRNIIKDLSNGDKVVVKASVSVYKPRGSYQLIVSDIEPAGFGALAKAFVELKAKLDAEGLTKQEKKRPVPSWPQGIALITSDKGAAVQDVLITLRRRAPFIPIQVYPTLVQGEQAPEKIMEALGKANADQQADVILLVRGGGSIEDLQAFNHEALAYAIANSRLPVVTGVGHETDFTIADFVSDYRAATPTAAAEIASPDRKVLASVLNKHTLSLSKAIQVLANHKKARHAHLHQQLMMYHPVKHLQQQGQRIDEIAMRFSRWSDLQLTLRRERLSQMHRYLLAQSPQHKLSQSKKQLSHTAKQLSQAICRRLDEEQKQLQQKSQTIQRFSTAFNRYQQQLKGLQARLTLLSPLGLLDRGYVMAFDDNGKVIRSVNDISANQLIEIRFSDGDATALIQKKESHTDN